MSESVRSGRDFFTSLCSTTKARAGLCRRTIPTRSTRAASIMQKELLAVCREHRKETELKLLKSSWESDYRMRGLCTVIDVDVPITLVGGFDR
jgi:hypothetical protein